MTTIVYRTFKESTETFIAAINFKKVIEVTIVYFGWHLPKRKDIKDGKAEEKNNVRI